MVLTSSSSACHGFHNWAFPLSVCLCVCVWGGGGGITGYFGCALPLLVPFVVRFGPGPSNALESSARHLVHAKNNNSSRLPVCSVMGSVRYLHYNCAGWLIREEVRFFLVLHLLCARSYWRHESQGDRSDITNQCSYWRHKSRGCSYWRDGSRCVHTDELRCVHTNVTNRGEFTPAECSYWCDETWGVHTDVTNHGAFILKCSVTVCSHWRDKSRCCDTDVWRIAVWSYWRDQSRSVHTDVNGVFILTWRIAMCSYWRDESLNVHNDVTINSYELNESWGVHADVTPHGVWHGPVPTERRGKKTTTKNTHVPVCSYYRRASVTACGSPNWRCDLPGEIEVIIRFGAVGPERRE